VNANGEIQTVKDPALLKTAAGCLGLLGVVTSLTLRLEPMTFARMTPRAPHVLLTIPPPKGTMVPDELRSEAVTEQEKQDAWAEFVRACENDYFVQWFWFAYQDQCWVNTWHNNGTKKAAEPYPNALTAKWQFATEAISQVANDTFFEAIEALEKLMGLPVGRTQAKLLGETAMANFSRDETTVAPLIDALHFQRGIHNMRVLDMEVEIPIPPRTDDPNKPDWTICQKAWWDVITHVYERKDSPMRVAMELRITWDSDMVMAPQYGNRLGTAAIEVVTTENTNDEDWRDFMREIANRWFSYKGPDGRPLNDGFGFY